MRAEKLAEQLAKAFGKPEEIVALMSEDVEWWLSPPIAEYIAKEAGIAEFKGIDAMRRVMNTVFGTFYDPKTVSVDTQEVIGSGDRAVVRLKLRTKTTWGADYENDYAIFVHERDGKIHRAYEYVDASYSAVQLGGLKAKEPQSV